MFFHPRATDIHEKRKQAGISEGVVSFFQPFTSEQEPIQCISTVNFTHVLKSYQNFLLRCLIYKLEEYILPLDKFNVQILKEIEPNVWLNIVLTHPDSLYGLRAAPETKEESETIANAKFHTSLFRHKIHPQQRWKRQQGQYYKKQSIFSEKKTQRYSTSSQTPSTATSNSSTARFAPSSPPPPPPFSSKFATISLKTSSSTSFLGNSRGTSFGIWSFRDSFTAQLIRSSSCRLSYW